MKEFFIAALITLIILLLMRILTGGMDLPFLRERFGTVMWHSSDKEGVYLGSYQDPNAQDHVYCYYPTEAAQSALMIKKVEKITDCQNWLGIAIFREGSWVSEREKYYWPMVQ